MSWSRTIYSIVAFSALPCISCRWKKPSYPSVWAGVSSAGSRALYSMAINRALRILSLEVPGWMLKPLMVTTVLAALKVSYS